MGRPRKPNHLKILAGEREDRINRNAPIPAESDIIPPDLSPQAQEVWDRLAPDLIDKGCLTSWDVDLFSAYCEAVATYHECRDKMGTDYVVQGSTRNSVPSPYWRVMQDCIAAMVKIGARFGLTPSDRAGIDTSENKPVHPASRFFT
jgi:P27 family predicted phage terminase small subunit